MAPIRFALDSDPEYIRIAVKDHPALLADVSLAVQMLGGTMDEQGLRLEVVEFRRLAEDLGALMSRHGVQGQYEPAVLDLIRGHAEEVRRRREAEVWVPTDFKPLERDLKPTRFNRDLKDHQKRAVIRLMGLTHGANFSVPGGGKTATALAIYELGRAQGQVDRLLVVCPKNAFISWQDELKECFKGNVPTSERVAGGTSKAKQVLAKDPEVALVTYQFLPNALELVRDWCKRHRAHVILDESHRIKSGRNTTSMAALSLAGVSRRRDILSGTPMPQSPEDLRPQLGFLWPGHRIIPGPRIELEADQSLIAQVQEAVRPLYIRTTKDDLELPKLTVRPVPVPLGPIQSELYNLLRSEAAREAAGYDVNDRAALRALGKHVLRLVQAATNPLLLSGSPEDNEEDVQGTRAFEIFREFARSEKPAKIYKAVELTRTAIESGKEPKVLLWSSFIKNINHLEKLLKDYHPVVLHGSVLAGDVEDESTREHRIRKFHMDDDCKVMIANPAACGESISLHRACKYAIYVDRTFNAAHFLQSVDRIHRLGSTEPVNVDVLEAAGTIDARVQSRIRQKVDAMADILDDEELRRLAYDSEDVEDWPGGIDLTDVKEIREHLEEA